jgi:AcrR family transcriptional regulator
MSQSNSLLEPCEIVFSSDTLRIVTNQSEQERVGMPSDTAEIGKRAPGRPRSDATQRAIMDATIELVGSLNYPDVTIEKIAARAKVGKQSIYRWWPTKADLVLDAFTLHSLKGMPPVIQSSDAFADLEQDIARFFAFMSDPLVAKGVRSLIAEAQHDDEFRRKLYEQVHRVRCEALRRAFRYGIALGQFRDDMDFDALAHVIHGAFWYRFLSGTVFKADADYAHRIVAMLRPGMSTVPPSPPRAD